MTACGRRTLAALLCLTLAGCASRAEMGEGWTRMLAVPPGSSLPQEPFAKDQTITLFTLTQTRVKKRQFFLAGSGYAEINGGGRHFAGMNRGLDPHLEVDHPGWWSNAGGMSQAVRAGVAEAECDPHQRKGLLHQPPRRHGSTTRGIPSRCPHRLHARPQTLVRSLETVRPSDV